MFVRNFSAQKIKGSIRMAKNYSYKESKIISKKMTGTYNGATFDIEVDGEIKNVIDELKAFDGQFLEIAIKIKEENDLDSDDK